MSLHIDDVGTVLEITVLEAELPVDLSTCATKKIVMEKKKGEVMVVDAEFVTDGTDGKIKYVFQEGDLDIEGKWKVQVEVSFANGTWHSDIGILELKDNIIIPAPQV